MSATIPPTTTDSAFNNPLINTITGYISHIQAQHILSKQRLHKIRQNILITIGFLVLIYCLIKIQILFFWLIKLILRLSFKILSIIFWLPLKTVRFFIPKTIDYDILFPLFWLCSISSFYLAKFSHENVCRFYDQYLIQRYKIFHNDQNKREEIKRYLFAITFIFLLIVQSLFILLPVALSIRSHHHQQYVNSKTLSSSPIIPTTTTTTTTKTIPTTVKGPTAQSAVKDVVETMGESLYNRFINAFKDENETRKGEKRSPLVSDEKLEDTLKIIQKSLKNIKSTKNEKPVIEEKKTSRFQRWIVHYLKAPFQKYEKKTNDDNKIISNVQEEENIDIGSSSDTDEEDDDDDQSLTEKIKQRLETVKNISVLNDEEDSDDEEEEEDEDDDDLASKLSSSPVDDDDEEEEEDSISDKIKKQYSKTFSSSTKQADVDSGYESDDEDEERSSQLVQKIKEGLTEPVEKIKNISTDIKNKINALSDTEDEDEDDDDESASITEKIQERLVKPVQNVVHNVKDKLSSSINTDEEDSKIETDKDEEEEEESVLDRVKNLRDKLPSLNKDNKEDLSLTDRTKQTAEKVVTPIKDKISSNIDELKHVAADVVHSAEEFGSDIFEKSSKYVHEKTEQLKDALPTAEKISSNIDELKHVAVDVVHSAEEFGSDIFEKSSKYVQEKTEQLKDALPTADKISTNINELKHVAEDVVHSAEEFGSDILEKSSEYVEKKFPQTKKLKSKIKHDIIEPLEAKASEVKKAAHTKAKKLKTTVVDKIKSLKKPKKPKTLTEKVKEKFKDLQDKLPGRKKKKVEKKFQLITQAKLNGWIDEAWNIWHLTRTKLSHIFILSTKHARHLPRYNTTSLYTAFTDIKCYDYTKKSSPYRLLKRQYVYFLDSYRHHSPFPVYLSILKSNGPKCYRQYPDSSCGLISKSSNRNFKIQLYRFVRFWAIISIIIVFIALMYKKYTTQKQTNSSSSSSGFNKDSDQSSNRKQQTVISNRNDISKSTTTATTTATGQRPLSIHQKTLATGPLNEQVKQQLYLWLVHEKNDGFRNLSETCRTAINNTFLKQLERLSVETLQFANAKIHNVSQNNNNNKINNAERIIINATLDIDHLILNIVNTYKEQHFSLETQKLSGQLHIILTINSNQYSIEANLQQLQIHPVNIIDPNNVLSADEKHSIVKLLDETINRTIVRCSFRLSDNHENVNSNTLYNSSQPSSYPEANTKTYSSSNQLSTSSIQSNAPRSRQATPNRYQPSEPLPTVLINDIHQNLYTDESLVEKEPKRLLVRIVKAVKLHDVEQPYCILELSHPKQIHQTSIAKNGLNPFWDERFLFECDDKSNQLHLQIIDRKKPIKRSGNNYVDTLYADVSIPFSYITSTVYKQDVQISPQYPESIIRIEFSTLSEEEALAANNGYDVESLTDSQTWPYNEREANKIEQDYPQRYQQTSSSDFVSPSYDSGTLPKHYGLSTSLYDDERDYAATLPRSVGLQSSYSPSSPLTPRDGGSFGHDKPQKSKSFMNSLKNLTLPRRKHRHKDKHDSSMCSQASSISQLNTSLQSPPTNTVSHSLSSALPEPYTGEYFLSKSTDSTPIRRSRSISQSFKNLFRSNSKKKANAARTDALGEFENGVHHFVVDNRSYLTTSTPTTKKLSFLQRRKSKQKAKEQTNLSTNSLSSYDYSRVESVRDTPIRANVGHPVTMTKSLVR